ncbi:hypothetical protein MBLNU230_g3292t1 [Neophaeotheca triangularis]
MVMRPMSDADVQKAAASIHQPRDPNTLSNYNAWRTKHTTANFEIDFDAKHLKGDVTLSLERLARSESSITLDTSYLDISSVRVQGEEAKFELASQRHGPYGSPLRIEVSDRHQGQLLHVNISVKTTKDCTALQWMTPAQTSNKKHPYMFSQCQAIHARSLFPCQDTPDVKSTYTFNIRSSLPVLASGLPTGAKDFKHGREGKPGTLLYTFNQPIPMASYLFALASGDLASASIGPRSSVWTGPEELTACQWEFAADTEKYIQTAESIVSPYAWTQYNILVLPPSFPYGGMENPIFTFATPTVVSGDRQNVDVIAHELSHSWSGNLVSNASWEHFWLNEGWTTYLERRLQASIHGGFQHRDFSAIIGWKALTDSINQFGGTHEFTKLIPNLKGQDPDDAFSSIPYEKGFTFLLHLEKLVGLEKWDAFIPHYFRTYSRRSVDSYEFKATLLDFFSTDQDASSKLTSLDWDGWFYSPGLPPKPTFDTSLVDECYALAEKWTLLSSGADTSFTPSPSDITSWTSSQSVVFLETLQTSTPLLKPSLVTTLGETYAFTTTANIELLSRYYVLGLKAGAEAVYKPTAELLGRVGRMKFVRPLLRELLKRDPWLAKWTVEANKEFYHPICWGMIERMVRDFDEGKALSE